MYKLPFPDHPNYLSSLLNLCSVFNDVTVLYRGCKYPDTVICIVFNHHILMIKDAVCPVLRYYDISPTRRDSYGYLWISRVLWLLKALYDYDKSEVHKYKSLIAAVALDDTPDEAVLARLNDNKSLLKFANYHAIEGLYGPVINGAFSFPKKLASVISHFEEFKTLGLNFFDVYVDEFEQIFLCWMQNHAQSLSSGEVLRLNKSFYDDILVFTQHMHFLPDLFLRAKETGSLYLFKFLCNRYSITFDMVTPVSYYDVLFNKPGNAYDVSILANYTFTLFQQNCLEDHSDHIDVFNKMVKLLDEEDCAFDYLLQRLRAGVSNMRSKLRIMHACVKHSRKFTVRKILKNNLPAIMVGQKIADEGLYEQLLEFRDVYGNRLPFSSPVGGEDLLLSASRDMDIFAILLNLTRDGRGVFFVNKSSYLHILIREASNTLALSEQHILPIIASLLSYIDINGEMIDVNRYDEGMTAVHLACSSNLVGVLNLLLSHKADLHSAITGNLTSDMFFNTDNVPNALMLACYQGHIDIVKSLLGYISEHVSVFNYHYRVSISVDTSKRLIDVNALDIACMKGFQDVVEVFLSCDTIDFSKCIPHARALAVLYNHSDVVIMLDNYLAQKQSNLKMLSIFSLDKLPRAQVLSCVLH